MCLQETKCVDEAFPREAIEAAGYNVAVHGQKAFNGVAILSKAPFDDVTPRLPGDDEDSHARFLEASISTKRGVVRVASIYLPNGNPPAGEKYTYKLKWMDRLIHYARERLTLEEPLILAGDYNVIASPIDARNPAAWVGDAYSCRKRASVSAGYAISASPIHCARAAIKRVSTLFGITKPAPGRRTMASVSTISCCRRRPPTC